MTESQAQRFFYIRDESGLPVVCVVSQKTEGFVRFAVATYNSNDPFSKATARQVAEGRLQAGKLAMLPLTETVNLPRGVKQGIITNIACDKKYPHRARRVAQSWLMRALEKQAATK